MPAEDCCGLVKSILCRRVLRRRSRVVTAAITGHNAVGVSNVPIWFIKDWITSWISGLYLVRQLISLELGFKDHLSYTKSSLHVSSSLQSHFVSNTFTATSR